jgi:hypothetical protein
MQTKKTNLLGKVLAACLLLHFPHVQAQLKPKTLRVAFLNEAIKLPDSRLLSGPLHPTLNVGTDLRVRSKKHWQSALGADFYYNYHRLTEHALMLDASYRLGYRFGFGLQLNLHTALGYKHAILAGDKFALKEGEYQKTTHWGKAMLNAKIGLGLEYPVSQRYSLLADYKAMGAYPTGGFFVPFSAHTLVGAGLKINLKN